MMTDANDSHELRGSSSNSTTNFSQTISPSLASVKTEPNCYNVPSVPMDFDAGGRNVGESSTTLNFSNHQMDTNTIKVKEEPRDDNINHNPTHSKIVLESCDSEADGYNLMGTDTENKTENKSRKRKADPLSIDHPNDIKFEELSNDRGNLIIGHICELNFREGWCPQLESNEARGIKNLFEIIPIDVITNLAKSNLSPCNIKSVLETNTSCNVKSYKWEKLVDNEFISKIDENIRRTIDSILVPEDEYTRTLNEVMSDLSDTFNNRKGKIRWHCIGSYSYGIVDRNSPIDVYCENLSTEYAPLNSRPQLWVSASFNERFSKLGQKICHKEISWMNLEHKNTGKRIHMTFSNALETRASLLMKLFLGMNPNLKYLIVYVQYILTKCQAYWTPAGVEYRIIFWLVAFFLQQKKLLPAVIDVRKAADTIDYVSGWDCSLPEHYSFPIEPVSLYSLLLGFFDFYKDFDYLNCIICPYLGRILALSDVERLEISTDEFSAYLRQIRKPDQINFNRWFLNLQDPTDLSFNLGIKLKPYNKLIKFKVDSLNRFKFVCQLMTELLPNEIAEIEKMDCFCSILSNSFDRSNNHLCPSMIYASLPFYTHCTKSQLKANRKFKKLNQCYILEAIRKLMEVVFKFEPKNVAITQNFTHTICSFDTEEISKRKIQSYTFPVMHFEYCSSEKTWQSDYMKKIIPRSEGEKEPVRIYLRCEFCLQKRSLTIFAQTENKFASFLNKNFVKVFLPILTEILPS